MARKSDWAKCWMACIGRPRCPLCYASAAMDPARLRHWLFGAPGTPGFLLRLGISVAFTSVLLTGYHVIARVVTPTGIDLTTPLDPLVPFVPWTVWFYVPLYALVFLIPLSIVEDWRYFGRMALLLTATAVPGSLIHLLLPIQIDRPPAPEGPGLTLAMLRAVYGTDLPVNTFPSLHVAMATSMTVAAFGLGRRAGALSLLFNLLMTVSVLTLKQHFAVDILGGWALSAFAVWVSRRRGDPRPRLWP